MLARRFSEVASSQTDRAPRCHAGGMAGGEALEAGEDRSADPGAVDPVATEAHGPRALRAHDERAARAAEEPAALRRAGTAASEVGRSAESAGEPTRRARLFAFAEARHVPLRAILAVDLVAVATYVAAILVVKLREVILLVVISGFLALVLNPPVAALERRGLRRGAAAGVVFLFGVIAFVALAFAFGYPLVRGLTHFADEAPRLVRQAEHGRGWIGHLVHRYHLEAKVREYSPELAKVARNLARPALSLGKATLSAIVGLATIAMLTLLFMLEAPRLSRGLLGAMRPERAERVRAVAAQVSRAVTGYMVGNLLTSLVAGVVVLVDLLVLGVPFAPLLAIWVGIVDLLPMVGGLLAGVVVVVVAAVHSLVAGIVTLVVFLVYQQVENHVLNPVVMSRTVRISPLLVLLAVLVGANVGDLVGAAFGGFVGALLAIPLAGALQVVAREAWAWGRERPGPGGAPESS
jgi:predicted PurR-regulated permease PerM